MTEPGSIAPQRQAVATWLFVMLALGIAGTLIITRTYNLDCSIPETHESANTPFGWIVASVVTGVPLVLGVSLGRRHSAGLVIASLLVAALQIAVWVWLFNDPGSCDHAFDA